MDYILRNIDIELWSKVKAKATLERKTMREVILESLKWYVTPVETGARSDKKKKGGKEGLRKGEDGCSDVLRPMRVKKGSQCNHNDEEEESIRRFLS